MYRKTKQRERILEVLKSAKGHPTADWLFIELKKEFPRLSLGTVYRNLAILIEQGLVQKIHFNSTYDRFEANTKPHYHMICDRCGSMEDLNNPPFQDLDSRIKNETGFLILSHRLEFHGLCSKCRKKAHQIPHAKTGDPP